MKKFLILFLVFALPVSAQELVGISDEYADRYATLESINTDVSDELLCINDATVGTIDACDKERPLLDAETDALIKRIKDGEVSSTLDDDIQTHFDKVEKFTLVYFFHNLQ